MPQIQSGIQRHTPSKGERGTPRGNERDIPLALALPADTVRDRTPAFHEAILDQHGPGGVCYLLARVSIRLKSSRARSGSLKRMGPALSREA